MRGPRDDECTGNQLLDSLEADALARVKPLLTPVSLRAHDVLYQANEPMEHVYFLVDGVIVQLAADIDGRTIETATVGHEGASWISASESPPSMPCQTVVAIEGIALRMRATDLARELAVNPALQRTLTEYSHALLIATMRTAGCTGLHDVSQRCARWILQTLDRVPLNRFAVTHEFLSGLLGTRRATISVTIEAFEAARFVEIQRGWIKVVDRTGLESATCECYQIIRGYYEKVGRIC